VLRTDILPEGERINFFLSLRERMKVRVFVVNGDA